MKKLKPLYIFVVVMAIIVVAIALYFIATNITNQQNIHDTTHGIASEVTTDELSSKETSTTSLRQEEVLNEKKVIQDVQYTSKSLGFTLHHPSHYFYSPISEPEEIVSEIVPTPCGNEHIDFNDCVKIHGVRFEKVENTKNQSLDAFVEDLKFSIENGFGATRVTVSRSQEVINDHEFEKIEYRIAALARPVTAILVTQSPVDESSFLKIQYGYTDLVNVEKPEETRDLADDVHMINNAKKRYHSIQLMLSSLNLLSYEVFAPTPLTNARHFNTNPQVHEGSFLKGDDKANPRYYKTYTNGADDDDPHCEGIYDTQKKRVVGGRYLYCNNLIGGVRNLKQTLNFSSFQTRYQDRFPLEAVHFADHETGTLYTRNVAGLTKNYIMAEHDDAIVVFGFNEEPELTINFYYDRNTQTVDHELDDMTFNLAKHVKSIQFIELLETYTNGIKVLAGGSLELLQLCHLILVR